MTNNKQQTAVDNILAKLNNVKPTEFCSIEIIKKWCEQAKEMEKEQIIEAYHQGVTDEYGDALEFGDYTEGEAYYNEIYGKNE